MSEPTSRPTARPASAERHIGPDDHQVTEMLKALGVSSLEALMDDAVPGRIRSERARPAGRRLRAGDRRRAARDRRR